ncbi:DUF4181 domain-containing protein [Lysinibacillus parviboronicapiens]|uniref:DUF4181 domain-containing protein n=1 Tax=Lysinibacillus parviboronicapiens TaxID=436516 RepID=UPI0006D0DF89|nr:DUF4181 domain-containing protein [Lysinibacillus parviboronicapiens]
MLKLIVFSVIMFSVWLLIDKYLYKRFQIQKQANMMDKTVHRLQIIVEIVILLLFIIGLIGYFYFTEVREFPIGSFIFLSVAIYGFRAIMEWQFNRASKRYIVMLSTLAYFVSYLSILSVFMQS